MAWHHSFINSHSLSQQSSNLSSSILPSRFYGFRLALVLSSYSGPDKVTCCTSGVSGGTAEKVVVITLRRRLSLSLSQIKDHSCLLRLVSSPPVSNNKEYNLFAWPRGLTLHLPGSTTIDIVV